MSFISFSHPNFLFLLFIIPVFVLIYFFSYFYNKKKAVIFPNFEAMRRISDLEFFSKGFTSFYINLAIILFLILSLCGANLNFNASTSSFSYVFAIDSSGSMQSSDLSSTRLDAAKSFSEKLTDALPIGTDIGVVSFAGDAVIVQDLDNSKLVTKMSIGSITPGTIEGTNVYSAVVVSGKILEGKMFKSIVLISDGQINVGDADEIVKYAKDNNIVINTFGVGTEKGVTQFGTISSVDEDFLKAIAQGTGGQFFRINSVDDFNNSFDILTKTTRAVSMDLSIYLILAAILLLMIDWTLYNFRFKGIP